MAASSKHGSNDGPPPSPRRRPAVVAIAIVAVVLIGTVAIIGSTRRASGQASGTSDLQHAAVLPAYGPTHGGTKVTVVASGLQGVTSVDFGLRPARFVVNSDTSITAIAPGGSGTVAIIVTNPTKSPTRSVKGRFTYLAPPTVSSVTPSSGPASGGTRVLVRGAGFVPGTRLFFGGHRAARVSVRNVRALFAVSPSGFGTDSLRVITPGGASHATASVRFSYRARVLVIGDSLGIDLGWGFGSTLPQARLFSVVDDAVGSTGLVRWDYYNWPLHLRADLAAVHPQYVVALFGANDQQRIPTPGGLASVGTQAWVSAVEARVRLLSSIVTSHGAVICWLGLPRMGPHSVVSSSFVQLVNRIDSTALHGIGHALFVSTAGLFTTAAGRYTPMVRLPAGAIVVGRQPDGVHLTPDGATAVDALAVAAMIRLAR